MEFPITDLLSRDHCTQWIVEHFHPNGFGCNHCGARVEQARQFRTTRRSQLIVYRCRRCDQTYNCYTGTLLEQHYLRPEQVVLFLRGILKGESSKTLANELQLSYKTVLTLRHQLHERAEQLQPDGPLPDSETETDKMFGECGVSHVNYLAKFHIYLVRLRNPHCNCRLGATITMGYYKGGLSMD